MARLPRFTQAGYAYHVIQRGNNRQVIFNNDDDMAAYACWLKEYSAKCGLDIHAWVFMTNHVHLLVSPKKENSLSQVLQSLGRMYVRYFNNTYKRSGTLWEGRFKSCVVADDEYFLTCSRYIELNPVRAGMVFDPSEYPWSSYQSNALGRASSMINPHKVYLALGESGDDRQSAYRSLFDAEIGEKLISEIRNATNKGLAVGSDCFKAQIEQNHNRRITAGKAGRPRKESLDC